MLAASVEAGPIRSECRERGIRRVRKQWRRVSSPGPRGSEKRDRPSASRVTAADTRPGGDSQSVEQPCEVVPRGGLVEPFRRRGVIGTAHDVVVQLGLDRNIAQNASSGSSQLYDQGQYKDEGRPRGERAPFFQRAARHADAIGGAQTPPDFLAGDAVGQQAKSSEL